ncbi:hypothetical protein H5410_046126 [Solanum commersonii]|uniref:Protein kinase domain-containing protein n=1 Tax=Solanum commersonii TaxID=4109 RepID=A0A9J5XEN8_SOLCO|nr:hypothetical protein H5410_046126 [Solanum commersonii]
MVYQMDAIAKLINPYIVEYKDAGVEKVLCYSVCRTGFGTKMIIMAKIIRKSRGGLFPEEKLCKWLTQLLLAVDYLHLNRVLHRDVNLSNIFVTKHNDIRPGKNDNQVILDSQTFSIDMVLLPRPLYEITISTLDKPTLLFRTHFQIIQLRKACSHPYRFGGIELEPYEEGEHLVQVNISNLI